MTTASSRSALALLFLLGGCGSDACPPGSIATPEGRCVEAADGSIPPDAASLADAQTIEDAALDGGAEDAPSSVDGGSPDAGTGSRDAGTDACAAESCDGVDQDCDGRIDEDLPALPSYRDADGDGHGDPAVPSASCRMPAGYVATSSDCDDGDPAVHPLASEACNGGDDDCDALIDEGVELTYYRDRDGDGSGDAAVTDQACRAPVGYVTVAGDCDDTCSSCRPGGTETCDGRDNDCDGVVDDGVTTLYYPDCDYDGYAAAGSTSRAACSLPAGGAPVCPGGTWTVRAPTTPATTDCADAEAFAHPAATGYFSAPIAGAPAGRAYDYDCDGVEERRDTGVFACSAACDISVAGWFSTVPACGASAEWVNDCFVMTSCRTSRETRAQACR